MDEALPTQTHVYQNHTMDCTRWDGFDVREDDIVIATPYKWGRRGCRASSAAWF